MFGKSPKIKYQIQDCVETGIIVSKTDEVGGTFDVSVKLINSINNANIFDEILDAIDQLDHSTISDNAKIDEINERYFYIDLDKVYPIHNAITIFGFTLISLLEINGLIKHIESVTITLGKKSIEISTALNRINCIYSFAS